jgi:hypothetical protein
MPNLGPPNSTVVQPAFERLQEAQITECGSQVTGARGQFVEPKTPHTALECGRDPIGFDIALQLLVYKWFKTSFVSPRNARVFGVFSVIGIPESRSELRLMDTKGRMWNPRR